MSTETGYNGWSNRATWAVALHLGNDCNVQKYWEERTEEVCYENMDHEALDIDAATWQLEDELNEWVSIGIEEALEAGDFFTCLINDLVPEVNYEEITRGWVEDWYEYNKE